MKPSFQPTLALALLLASGLSTFGFACSSFRLPVGKAKEVIMAKSYDWNVEDGLVVINKKHVAKVAMVFGAAEKPAKWVAKYGSLTFNQHGRELPVSGMNSEGLAIEVLWLDESVGEPADKRPVVNELQWVQYQLDNYRSVAEVTKHLKELRISRIHAPVHYFLCDRQSECATIEYVEGKAVVTKGKALTYPAITNSTYADSVGYLNHGNFKGLGGDTPLPTDRSSLARFSRVVAAAKEVPRRDVKAAFHVLDQVFVTKKKVTETETQWNLVYDLNRKEVYFRTRDHWDIKTVKLDHFDLDCRKNPTVKILNMLRDKSEDVSNSFVDYTPEANQKLIETSCARLMLPKVVLQAAIAYPDNYTQCK